MLVPLSAHIGYLFADAPLAKRFGLAKAAWFDAVEHPAPFELPATELRKILAGEGLRLSQITSDLGHPGEKGIAALPGREAEFREGFKRALDYAEEAGAHFVHAMAGAPPLHDRGARAEEAYRSNMDAALAQCAGRKPRLLIETISHSALPFYHLNAFDQRFKTARELPGILCLVDSYHAAANGEDMGALIKDAAGRLGHIHLADFPGRHEPGSGNLDFDAILRALGAANYDGAIGFEYIPSQGTHLGWLPKFRAKRDAIFHLR